MEEFDRRSQSGGSFWAQRRSTLNQHNRAGQGWVPSRRFQDHSSTRARKPLSGARRPLSRSTAGPHLL
jgi:hypothetical protein